MSTKQQVIDAVNVLLSLAQDLPSGDEGLLQQISDLQAQVAALQSQLNQAQAALQAEVSLEQADQDKIVALQAKISTALVALQA